MAKDQATIGQLGQAVPVPDTMLEWVAVSAATELGEIVMDSDDSVYKKYVFNDGKPWIEFKLQSITTAP